MSLEKWFYSTKIRNSSCIRTGWLITGMALGVSAALAQERVGPPELAAPPGLPRAYVVDFQQLAAAPNVHDLAQFTSTLIRLQLLEVPELEVISIDKEPVCGGQGKDAQAGTGNPPLSNQSLLQHGSPARATLALRGDFVIGGWVDVHPPDIKVGYSIKQCNGAALVELASGHPTFAADKSLEQINSVSQFAFYAVQNRLQPPSTAIAVGSFKGDTKSSAQIAKDLAEYLTQTAQSWHGFRLSENPDYTIEGEISAGRDAVTADVRLRSRDDRTYPVQVSGTRKDPNAFRSKVADRTIEALKDVLLARRLGWKEYLNGKDTESLVLEGKRLLCEDQPAPCRQFPDAALRVLLSARSRTPRDWNILYYLGKAEAANDKYSSAIVELKEALGLISTEAAPETERKKAVTQVRNALGDVYLKSGDVKNGVSQYEESLKADADQPDIYVRKAEVLFLSDRPAGIEVLLDGVRQMPAAEELHKALLENIRKLGEPDFQTVEPQFRSASAAGVSINDEYALLWILWGETGQVNADLARQRQYVANALELHPKDVEVRAEVYALAATINLPANLAEAEKFLTQAEALLPNEQVLFSTLSWLARLRAIYFLDQNKYAEASDWAEKARTIDGSYASDLLSAQVANGWAKYLGNANTQHEQATRLFTKARDLVRPLVDYRYQGADSEFDTANHGLGDDQESMKVLKAIVDKNPQDFSATLSLAFVCSEYLFDTGCCYSQNKKLLSLDLSALSVSDRAAMKLNAAEAAVLDGEYRQASIWLNGLAIPEIGAQYRAIADFYRFWIALVRNEPDAKDDLDRLKQSLALYAQVPRQPSPEQSTWSFLGARHALGKSELSSKKRKVLSDVIAVFDDPSKDIAAIKLPSEM